MNIAVIGVENGWSSIQLMQALKNTTATGVLVELKNLTLDLVNRRAMCGDVNLFDMDAAIVKKVGRDYSHDDIELLEMLRFINEEGIPVFSKPANILKVFNRLSCTVTLKAQGIPIPETIVTDSVAETIAAVDEFGQAILKPIYSSKAQGMVVVKKGPDLKDKVERFKLINESVFYVQKLLDINGRDVGVVFLGGDYIGTYARVGEKGIWNTTTKFGGHYEPYEPSKEIIDLAFKSQDLFKLDFTCVDIAESSNGLVVFEVSAFGGFRGLKVGCKIDAAKLYVDYVLARLESGK